MLVQIRYALLSLNPLMLIVIDDVLIANQFFETLSSHRWKYNFRHPCIWGLKKIKYIENTTAQTRTIQHVTGKILFLINFVK